MRIRTQRREYILRFFHYAEPNAGPHPRGTECLILDARDGVVISRGYAYCSPKDRFVKETGRKIALAGALGGKRKNGHWSYRNSPWVKPERRDIWNAYFRRNSIPVICETAHSLSLLRSIPH